VNGLTVGAPVKFHGVPIGAVTQIRSRIAHGAAVPPEEFRIPVWFDLDQQQISDLGAPDELDRPRVDELVAQGLRAQLQLESIVTGVLYLGLDFFPDAPMMAVHADRPDILEIPTVPTALEHASQVATRVLEQLGHADIAAAVHSVAAAGDGVNALVRSPELARTVAAVGAALESIQRSSDAARPMLSDFRAATTGARDSLHHVDATLDDVRTLIDADGPLSVELTRTLASVGEAARSVRDLAAYLERNPNALLVGRAGP